MKNLWFVVLLIGLCGCSQKAQAPKKPAAAMNRYAVTFAAIKIPDSTFTSLGLSPHEEPWSIDSRRKLATYVAAHLAEFSVTAPPTNVVPLVFNNGQVNLKILPEPTQEAKAFETLGLMTTQFIPGLSILEEDDKGRVYCDWYASCEVHLKEPIGNSNDHGRGGGCGSGMLAVGQFEIWPLLHGKDVSLWMLAGLNRP